MKNHYIHQAIVTLSFLASTALLQAASTIEFSASSYLVAESAGSVSLIVQRTDDVGTVVTVDYACADGTAKKGEKVVRP
jgi:hypothetical protein